FIAAENKFFADIFTNPSNTINTTTNKILEKKDQLETYKKNQTKHEQDLIKTAHFIKEINKEIILAKDENSQEILQKSKQILDKISAIQEELIVLSTNFIEEIELSLKAFSLIFTSVKNSEQLITAISHNEKLITQLDKQIEHEKEKQELVFITPSLPNNQNKLAQQLNDLQNQFTKLQKKKHEIINSLISFLKQDISFFRKKIKNNIPSSKESTTPILSSFPGLKKYIKKKFSFSKLGTTLFGLLGTVSLYKYSSNQPKTIESKKRKDLIKDQELSPPTDVKETAEKSFNDYYGSIPPEIKKLRNSDTQFQEFFLVGPGKKFLVQCLAGELNAPFNSFTISEFSQSIAKKMNEATQASEIKQIIETELTARIKKTHLHSKKIGSKKIIMHIDQISGQTEKEIAILSTIFHVIKNIKEQNNNSQLIISYSLNNPDLKDSIKELGFNVIEIPFPDKETREKVIKKENVKNNLSPEDIKNLAASTEGMKISELQDIIQKLQNSAGENPLAIQNLIKRKKKKEKRKKTEDCSFPEINLEEYIGTIPPQLLHYIENINANNTTSVKKFFLSAPDESGRKYLAQCIAGQFEAPFYEISLEEIIKSNKLQTSIETIQEISQEIKSKIAVIYIKEDIDLFLEEYCSHSMNEDTQKISRDQKIVIRKLVEQIRNIKNEKNLPKILLLCPLQASKENLKKAASKEKESLEKFILDKLIGPDVFDDILSFPLIEKNDRKKAWQKALKEGGPYNKELNIEELAKKSEGLSPGRIKKIIHEAKNITEECGETEISLQQILLAGANQLQLDEVDEEVNHTELQNFSFDFPNFKGTIPDPIKLVYLQLKFRHYFEEKGIKIPTGILICGEPGNGKTMVMKEIITRLNCPSVTFDCSETAQKYKGEGVKKWKKAVREVQTMQQLYPYARAIALKLNEGESVLRKVDLTNENSASDVNLRGKVLNTLEDFDSHAEERALLKMLRKKVKSKLTQENLQQLEKQLKKLGINLNLHAQCPAELPTNIQKTIEKEFKLRLRKLGAPVLTLISTNYKPSQLDPASTRLGRINCIAFFDFPDEKSRKDILQHWLRGQQLAKDFDLTPLSQLKRKTSGADLKFIAEQVSLKAAIDNQPINNTHLQQAIEKLKEEQKNRHR
ncbi:MAG: AAA family ATPase, partial [Candidatus Babeliales bacterium]